MVANEKDGVFQKPDGISIKHFMGTGKSFQATGEKRIMISVTT